MSLGIRVADRDARSGEHEEDAARARSPGATAGFERDEEISAPTLVVSGALDFLTPAHRSRQIAATTCSARFGARPKKR